MSWRRKSTFGPSSNARRKWQALRHNLHRQIAVGGSRKNKPPHEIWHSVMRSVVLRIGSMRFRRIWSCRKLGKQQSAGKQWSVAHGSKRALTHRYEWPANLIGEKEHTTKRVLMKTLPTPGDPGSPRPGRHASLLSIVPNGTSRKQLGAASLHLSEPRGFRAKDCASLD